MSWYEILTNEKYFGDDSSLTSLRWANKYMTHGKWPTVRSIENYSQLTQIETKRIQDGWNPKLLCGNMQRKMWNMWKRNVTPAELTEYMSNPPPPPTFIHQKLFHMNATCLFHIKRRQKQTKSGKSNKEKEVVRIEGGVDEYNIGAAGIVHSSQYQLLGPPLDLLLSFRKN